MNYIINGYSPATLFHYFEDISAIPRGSGNERAIADYLCAFAEEHSLEFLRDDSNNVLIKKPASNGYEDHPAVMLQGHTDMVCEKNGDVEHDFEKDPLKLKITDGWLSATGTTLGGDDGAAVAMMLSILDDATLSHPTLECLFTTAEETSMGGANLFDFSPIVARKLINLDSEEEGIVTVSCAGGADCIFDLETESTRYNGRSIKLTVKGLSGGHSGAEIHLCRANANKILARLLARLYDDEPFKLISINGGSKRNAIPREATAELCVIDEVRAKYVLLEEEKKITAELSAADEGFRLHIDKGHRVESAMTYRSTSAAIDMLLLAPNGVVAMSPVIENFVRTSSNLGVVTTDTESGKIRAVAMARSSCDSELDALITAFRRHAKSIGAVFSVEGRYSGWSPATSSELTGLYVDCYERQNPGKKATVAGIHAGLECGVIISKLGGNCDAISIGPNMRDIHTPDERLDLASCEHTYDLVVDMLSKL